MATVTDVAKRAGVSPMTVSRVVNGSGPVSPELRARVEQALAETGYVPNTVARNLRTKRTDTIALVMPDMTNPFFTALAQGVETAAREAGISLLLANTDQSEDEEARLVRMLLQRQVDGLLIIPAGSCAETVQLCRDQGVPLVVVDRRPERPGVDVVRGRLRGWRPRAGPAAGRPRPSAHGRAHGPGVGAHRGRPRGRLRAARSRGRACPPPLVINGDFTIDSGHDMALAAMREAAASHGALRGQQLHRHRRPAWARGAGPAGARGRGPGGLRRPAAAPWSPSPS